MLESFLVPMLQLNPDKRASAADMLAHEWLQGVVVQGEIEVHLAHEAKEEEQRRIEEGKRQAKEIGMDVESPGVVNGELVCRIGFATRADPRLAWLNSFHCGPVIGARTATH